MEWKEIKQMPKEKFGWFAVAKLPRNHSGSEHECKTDLEADNRWRESFGFTKAWLNNSEWYEPNSTGMRTDNITNLVTHWDYLPKVPILTDIFYSKKDCFLSSKMNLEEVIKVAKSRYNESDKKIDEESFIDGFISSFDFMGIR